MALLHRLRANQRRRQTTPNPQAPAQDLDTSVHWQFGAGDPPPADVVIEHQVKSRPRPDTPLLTPFQGVEGARRAITVRQGLKEALDAWWGEGQLPAPGLLRDSLLLLEAGHRLDEAQRSLILRGTVAQQRGMVTALRYQTDPIRTAGILAEAMLAPTPPLSAATVQQLRRRDPAGPHWYPHLLQRLSAEGLAPLEPRRSLARAGLWELRTGQPMTLSARSRPRRLNQTRLLLATAVLFLSAAFLLFWDQQGRQILPQGIVIVSPGIYVISEPTAAMAEETGIRRLQLQRYAIQSTEVTNQAYGRCVADGICSEPTIGVTDRLDPGKESHPVIGVTWYQADRYCRSIGMRLPLEEEWEVAASVAPASGVTYIFPWGNRYEPGLANGVSGSGQTRPVNSIGPAGASPMGLADMAGNVAEWTATFDEAKDLFVVKGGSYRDAAPLLRAAGWQLIDGTQAEPWLGFRCAVTVE